MLSKELNQRLTQTGADTPMGKLLRMYWHPIGAVDQMIKTPVRRVRVLGEDLTLYRGRNGAFGLIGARCLHRLVDLKFGFPSVDHDCALVCPYHGWTYDQTGQCVRQPAERSGGFKEKVKTAGYPVKALGGLIFAYLGPEPIPELPAWEPLVLEDTLRYIEYGSVECNWVQCQENSVDRTHVEWLHGHYAKYVMDRNKVDPNDPKYQATTVFTKFATDEFEIDPVEYGFVRRHTVKGGTKDGNWHIGQPMVFPAMNVTSWGASFTMIFRTPTDDHNTTSWYVHGVHPGEGIKVPPQDIVEAKEIPIFDARGEVNGELTAVQDMMAFLAQGAVLDRSEEWLGWSDRDIVKWRTQVLEQLDIFEKGGVPMNVFRDPARGKFIKLPLICRDDPNRFGVYNMTGDQKYQKRSATQNYSYDDLPILHEMEKYAELGTNTWLEKHRREPAIAMTPS